MSGTKTEQMKLCASAGCDGTPLYWVTYTESERLFQFCEFHAEHRVWPSYEDHYALGEWEESTEIYQMG